MLANKRADADAVDSASELMSTQMAPVDTETEDVTKFTKSAMSTSTGVNVDKGHPNMKTKNPKSGAKSRKRPTRLLGRVTKKSRKQNRNTIKSLHSEYNSNSNVSQGSSLNNVMSTPISIFPSSSSSGSSSSDNDSDSSDLEQVLAPFADKSDNCSNQVNQNQRSSKENGDKNGDDEDMNGSNNDKDGEDDELWEVERVLDKLVEEDGELKYFVKWKYWPESSNTWEPIGNLKDCRKKIKKYEAKSAVVKDYFHTLNAGFIFKSIRGIAQLQNGDRSSIHYIIEWEGTDITSTVPSSMASKQYPQQVIRFLESKSRWVPPPLSRYPAVIDATVTAPASEIAPFNQEDDLEEVISESEIVPFPNPVYYDDKGNHDIVDAMPASASGTGTGISSLQEDWLMDIQNKNPKASDFDDLDHNQ